MEDINDTNYPALRYLESKNIGHVTIDVDDLYEFSFITNKYREVWANNVNTFRENITFFPPSFLKQSHKDIEVNLEVFREMLIGTPPIPFQFKGTVIMGDYVICHHIELVKNGQYICTFFAFSKSGVALCFNYVETDDEGNEGDTVWAAKKSIMAYRFDSCEACVFDFINSLVATLMYKMYLEKE